MKIQVQVVGKIKGFTIVELLVSLVIAAIILSGVIQVAMSGKRSAMDGQEVAFIQDNARFVVDQLKRDASAAGFRGCAGKGSSGSVNAVKDDLDGFISMEQGVRGYEIEADTTALPSFLKDAKTSTDSLIVRFADADTEYKVKSHNQTNGIFTLWSPQTIEKGTTMLVTDASCRASALFQVTSSGDKANELAHAGDGIRNCTKVLRVDGLDAMDCSSCTADACGTNAALKFANGSSIMPYRAYAYYVGASDIVGDMPALKRAALYPKIEGTAAVLVEEIAHGVEDMQITYGVDTDDDDIANRLVKVNEVAGNWENVVSMRVRLVFRSSAPVFATDQEFKLSIDGEETLIGNDKYLRQVVTTNIKLRNS